MIPIITLAIFTGIANTIGIISGFGVGTILTPLLLLYMPFGEAILFVCIIHWFHDIFKVGFFKEGIDWRLFINFGIPTIIAAFFGALLVSPSPDQSSVLSALLGLFLIISVVMLYIAKGIKLPDRWYMHWAGGILSGFFAGIFGIRGAMRTFFLVSFDLDKAIFIGTTGAISLLLDSTRLIAYWWRGIHMPYGLSQVLFVLVPISFLGAYIGQRIVKCIPQKYFQKVVAFFLFLVGIRLLLIPWF